MSKLFDMVNTLDETTADLYNAKLLLRSVCDNYFTSTAKGTDLTMLHAQYDTFSTLIHMAKNMLWDIVAEYRKLSDELLDYDKSRKEHENAPERDYMDDALYQIARAEEAVAVLDAALGNTNEPTTSKLISSGIDILNHALPEAGDIICEYVKQERDRRKKVTA